VSAPIFISYSSKDQKIADTICRALEARGYDCWIACRNVGPGQNFQEAIVQALRDAKLMLLVFTSNANNSDEIKKEVALAGRHHVTVVPVRVEDVAPNDALAYEFATRQWIDLFDNWEQQIERLVMQIGSIISDKVSSPGSGGREAAVIAKQPKATPAPTGRSLRHPAMVAAFGALALLGLGGAYLVVRPLQPPATSAAAIPPTTALTSAQSAQAAPDENAWQGAMISGTVQALREYLDGFPDGGHVADARQRIQAADDRAWAVASGAGTMVSFKQYLGQFPTGAHAAVARSKVAVTTEDAQRHDGNWQATVVCTTVGRVEGYTISIAGQVKDGIFHAEFGVEGEPGWLSVDGEIEADGSAELHAHGRTGKVETTFNSSPRGTPYGYTILAQFTDSSGNGTRKEQRPCDFNALKH
jgi:hypothetical protein